MLYEPMRFKIPGGNYTPDFLAVCADGTMILVEIKGSRKAAQLSGCAVEVACGPGNVSILYVV